MGTSETSCKVCEYGVDRLDWTQSNVAIAREIGCVESTVRLHKMRGCGAERQLKSEWQAQGKGGEIIVLQSFKVKDDKDASVPEWPVIDRPSPRKIKRKITAAPLVRKWKTAIAGADTQIGFRRF